MTDHLNECGDPYPVKGLNIDPPTGKCVQDQLPSQKQVPGFESLLHQKTGLGQQDNCDPMQDSSIVTDLRKGPQPNVVYRYSKGFRACDEAMIDLFNDIKVIDERGVEHDIPITWASQERAVAMFLQSNVRKDNSLVVDRIELPMMAIYASEYNFNMERYTYHQAIDWLRDIQTQKPSITTQEKTPHDTVFGVTRGLPYDIGYTLYVWTLYWEDMSQILEQIARKFSPIAYIRIQGVFWETGVKIASMANNVDTEPGDQNNRVFKFQFTFTAETYLPQPIRRAKPVFTQKMDFVNAITDEEITEVISKLEQSIKEIE